MKYEVIHYFTDLQDFDHPYHVGDIFPHSGMSVSEERLKELSSSKNKQRKPLIKLVDEEPLPFSDSEIMFEEKPKYTRTEITRMNKAELQELASSMGAENAYSMTGAGLKEYLLNLFGL